MNFQDRFKGRTSTISKEGIQGVISSSKNPIRKTLNSSFSDSQLINRASSLVPVNQDQTPKLLINKKPFAPLASASNLQMRPSSIDPLPLEKKNPKNHTYTAGSQLHPFQVTENHMGQQQKAFSYGKAFSQMNHTEEYGEKNGQFSRSANQSKFSSLIPDHPSDQFNPNGFYNQQSQLKNPENFPKGPINIHRGKSEGTSKAGTDLKLNRNHLHKKNFESLSQQNRQRHGTKDVFRDYVSTGYAQRYARTHYLEEDSQGYRHRNSERLENQCYNTDRAGSYMHMKETDSSLSHTKLGSDTDEGMNHQERYNRTESWNSPQAPRGGKQSMQAQILNKLKNKLENMDLSTLQSLDEGLSLRSHSYRGGDWTDGKGMIRISPAPEHVKSSTYQNLPRIYEGKQKSEGNLYKLKN
jgi:hypothetical protein